VFAGKPAPTGIALALAVEQDSCSHNLWERVYPRKGQPWR
jgi:hypothetical protein